MNDLKSLLPSFSGPAVAPLPNVGSPCPVPTSFPLTSFTSPTIVAFVRHCGCPFAESEVRSLAALSTAHPTLHVVVVCHSPSEDANAWFSRIGGDGFSPSRVTLLADPTRTTYAAFGIGQLSFGALFSGKMWTELNALKAKGIVNTETVDGSYRWQNSGGFAVDATGVVRWRHLAEHAGDMCDYVEAAKSLGLE